MSASSTAVVAELQNATRRLQDTHLRDLVSENGKSMLLDYRNLGVVADCSRQKIDATTFNLLLKHTLAPAEEGGRGLLAKLRCM